MPIYKRSLNTSTHTAHIRTLAHSHKHAHTRTYTHTRKLTHAHILTYTFTSIPSHTIWPTLNIQGIVQYTQTHTRICIERAHPSYHVMSSAPWFDRCGQNNDVICWPIVLRNTRAGYRLWPNCQQLDLAPSFSLHCTVNMVHYAVNSIHHIVNYVHYTVNYMIIQWSMYIIHWARYTIQWTWY